MPPTSRLGQRALAVAGALAFSLLAGACSPGDDGAAPTPRTGQGGLIATVASYDLAVGPPSRVIVGVQGGERNVLAFGTVTMRFSYLGTREDPVGSPVAGDDVTATYLPIPGTPAPPDGASEARLVSGAEARGVYRTDYGFDRAGFWQVEVEAAVDGETRSATAAFPVGEDHTVPAPGDPAPRSENHTMSAPDDVPRAAIDSRAGPDGSRPIPDPELHSTTVAAALDAGRPVVVVVSTPVYCTSQFCGPITDMVQELSHDYGDRASFVHIEVYRDFQTGAVNDAAREWAFSEEAGGLFEPWVFVVGADGRISHRFDNVATRGELEPILRQLPVIGPAA